jgi:hypothetical protein
VVVGFQLLGSVSLGLVALSLQAPFRFAASLSMLGLVAIASAPTTSPAMACTSPA